MEVWIGGNHASAHKLQKTPVVEKSKTSQLVTATVHHSLQNGVKSDDQKQREKVNNNEEIMERSSSPFGDQEDCGIQTKAFCVDTQQSKSYENIISQQRRHFEALKKHNIDLRQKHDETEALNNKLQMELDSEKQFARSTRQQLRDLELKLQFDTFIMEEQKRENEMLKKLLSEEQKRNLIQEDQIRELRNQLQNTHLRIETQINDLQFFLQSGNR